MADSKGSKLVASMVALSAICWAENSVAYWAKGMAAETVHPMAAKMENVLGYGMVAEWVALWAELSVAYLGQHLAAKKGATLECQPAARMAT